MLEGMCLLELGIRGPDGSSLFIIHPGRIAFRVSKTQITNAQPQPMQAATALPSASRVMRAA